MKWQMYKADALPWLMEQSSDTFDALITDPPYSSGGLHSKTRTSDFVNAKYLNNPSNYPEFSGENRDQYSYLHWSTMWLAQAYRVLKVGAPIAVFTDWRQYPVMAASIQAAGFTWRGSIVWDKTESARPRKGAYRQQAEFALWGSKGKFSSEGPALPGVFRYSALNGGQKLHTTAKPLQLMSDIIKICPDGVILDPFAGSGTTGIAALRAGFRFVGVECEESYYNISCDRICANQTISK